jgi:hypothetical protein
MNGRQVYSNAKISFIRKDVFSVYFLKFCDIREENMRKYAIRHEYYCFWNYKLLRCILQSKHMKPCAVGSAAIRKLTSILNYRGTVKQSDLSASIIPK